MKKPLIATISIILGIALQFFLSLIGVNQIIDKIITSVIAPECVRSSDLSCVALAIPILIYIILSTILFSTIFYSIISGITKPDNT